MKMSKFRLAFIVLLIATIVWGIAFYYTFKNTANILRGCSRRSVQLGKDWSTYGTVGNLHTGVGTAENTSVSQPRFCLLRGYALLQLPQENFQNEKKPTLTVLEACSPPSSKRRAEIEQKKE